jgi:hypothetical protein
MSSANDLMSFSLHIEAAGTSETLVSYLNTKTMSRSRRPRHDINDWASNNTASNANPHPQEKTALKMFPWMREDYLVTDV